MPRILTLVAAADVLDQAERPPQAAAPVLQHTPDPSSGSWAARMCLYGLLTAATFVVHGYHPLAEDGGLYVAGVEYLLDPGLFPRYTSFVTGHLRFSLFAPALRALIRLTHLSLEAALLVAYLLGAFLMFAAADRLLRRAVAPFARWGGLLLLFTWWTLPVAGTALLLNDPYLTARNFVSPLSLLAISLILAEPQHQNSARSWRYGLVGGLVLVAACLHPLMCGYGLALLLCLLAVQSRRPLAWAAVFCAASFGLAAALQASSAPEPAALLAANISRYYWFPSLWHGYELLGLAGPLLVLYALQRWGRKHVSAAGKNLCRACLLLGAASIAVTAVFVHTSSPIQAVARMQPLRSFLLIYAVMVLLLGSVAASWWRALTDARRLGWPVRLIPPCLVLSTLAGIMYYTQRLEFPQSAHLELPQQSERSPNPWVRAFVWARRNTPKDALFALDPNYIEGDDAQAFRAIAQRSALPDYSKDGGEAAITPILAAAWQAGVEAQTGLNTLTDAEREARLGPLGVSWIVLAASAKTSLPCPYQNATVQVCHW